jgi:hypothetical protein
VQGEGLTQLLHWHCDGREDDLRHVLPIVSYDAQVSGDHARVTYTYDVAALNQDAEPWVREEGFWKTDDC